MIKLGCWCRCRGILQKFGVDHRPTVYLSRLPSQCFLDDRFFAFVATILRNLPQYDWDGMLMMFVKNSVQEFLPRSLYRFFMSHIHRHPPPYIFKDSSTMVCGMIDFLRLCLHFWKFEGNSIHARSRLSIMLLVCWVPNILLSLTKLNAFNILVTLVFTKYWHNLLVKFSKQALLDQVWIEGKPC